jgi:hypothetical protein
MSTKKKKWTGELKKPIRVRARGRGAPAGQARKLVGPSGEHKARYRHKYRNGAGYPHGCI